MDIKLNLQTRQAIAKLGRRGNQLQIIAAETVNEAAEGLDDRYKGKLKKNQRLRNPRFTLGGIKTFKANPLRKSGEPRQLGKINAITGVRKMKGGKKHYLAKLEDKDKPKKNSRTGGKVPVPLEKSRTSLDINKPIAGANRLTKGDTQTLRTGGKPFGVKGDRFKTSGQRFAVLYNHKRGVSGLTGDLKKPFFFIDNSNRLGIFKFIKNRARKIRKLETRVNKIKSPPNFKNAVKDTKPGDIQRDFVKKANMRLK